MQPTNKLRFIKRKVPVGPIAGSPPQFTEVRVLQQYWVPYRCDIGWAEIQVDGGEWRDVELVEDAE